MQTFNYIQSFATFSQDRKHRVMLHRLWDQQRPCATVIGLNPSNANEKDDDPTIGFVTRVLNFNGYGGLFMVNLFTMITPHPKDLVLDMKLLNAVSVWRTASMSCKDVVFAWGNFKTLGRNQTAKREFPKALCFDILKSGEPRHPM